MSDTPALLAGEQLAKALLPSIKTCVTHSSNPAHFWAGFLAAIAGMAIVDLGGQTADTLIQAAAKAADELHRLGTH